MIYTGYRSRNRGYLARLMFEAEGAFAFWLCARMEAVMRRRYPRGTR